MADLSTITKAELIKDLPPQSSISATDLYLLQTSVQSFKLQHSDLVANLVDNSTITVNGSNKLTVSSNVIQTAYPIGTVYINATNSSNPASLLGFGTWVKFGEGRVLIGEGTGTDTNAEDETFVGGSSGGEYNHTLTIDELAEHSHDLISDSVPDVSNNSQSLWESPNLDEALTSQFQTGLTGGDQPHNNIQPYITVYMWKRTA